VHVVGSRAVCACMLRGVWGQAGCGRASVCLHACCACCLFQFSAGQLVITAAILYYHAVSCACCLLWVRAGSASRRLLSSAAGRLKSFRQHIPGLGSSPEKAAAAASAAGTAREHLSEADPAVSAGPAEGYGPSTGGSPVGREPQLGQRITTGLRNLLNKAGGKPGGAEAASDAGEACYKGCSLPSSQRQLPPTCVPVEEGRGTGKDLLAGGAACSALHSLAGPPLAAARLASCLFKTPRRSPLGLLAGA